MIIQLTEKQLFDYIRCPVFYSLKYGDFSLNMDDPPSMSNLLNQVISGFCAKLMDGEVMRLDILKRKWDMLCRRHPELTTEQVREGMGQIHRFYQYAERTEMRVADIGSEYIIKVDDGEDRIEYHGNLGIITINSKNQPESIRFNFSTRLPDQADLDLAFKTTLEHVGFHRLYGQDLLGTRVHHLRRDRDFYTVRDYRTSLNKAQTIIRNVARSIRQNIWYPHEGPMCPKCDARNFCMVFGTGYDT